MTTTQAQAAPPPVIARARARDVPTEPVAAVRASRGTSRLFLVAAATSSHAQYLAWRLTALAASRWVTELSVYWPDSPPVRKR